MQRQKFWQVSELRFKERVGKWKSPCLVKCTCCWGQSRILFQYDRLGLVDQLKLLFFFSCFVLWVQVTFFLLPSLEVDFTEKRNLLAKWLQAPYISKLVKISGIVIAASRTKAKATYVTLLCKNCKNVKVVPCRPGLGGAVVPRSCDHAPQVFHKHTVRLWLLSL